SHMTTERSQSANCVRSIRPESPSCTVPTCFGHIDRGDVSGQPIWADPSERELHVAAQYCPDRRRWPFRSEKWLLIGRIDFLVAKSYRRKRRPAGVPPKFMAQALQCGNAAHRP